MNNNLLNFMQHCLIKEKNNIILDVNDSFLNLTEFEKDELCGKNINDILNKLFRCSYTINITEEEIQVVLFTKTLDVRFVKIKKLTPVEINNSTYINKENSSTYIDKEKNSTPSNNDINLYIFNEIENSRLDNKLLFIENLMNDNKIGIGIFTADNFKLIKANEKYLSYMPAPFNNKEISYGKCLHEFMNHFNKCGGEALLKHIVKTNKPMYFSELPSDPLNESDYWDNTITPVSENGEVKYIMSMLENVTERVLSRKHVHIKNKQFESIIESVEDIVSIVDRNGTYLKQNSLMKKLFGENKGRPVGYSTNIGTYCDLSGNPIPLNDLCFMNLMKGVKVKGQKMKYVYNDMEYYLSINSIPILDENNQFEMGVIVTHDITELVNKCKIVSNQKKELEIILDNMYDGLAVMDSKGNYIKKNKTLNNLISKFYNIDVNKVGDSIHKNYKHYKYYNDNDEELDSKEFPGYKLLKGEIVKEQRVIVKLEQTRKYLDFNGVPIFDENGNFQFGILLSHDITHIIENNNRIKLEQQMAIKAKQEKLEIAEKNLTMKDEFISLISHEFKTPLNVIFSAIQLIEYAYINEIPDKVQSLIQNIKQNTFRQLRLVNNLLDITRLNADRFKLNIKSIDVVSFIRQIAQSVRLYSDQKNIDLIFNCNLKCKNIAIDDEKLERIILNLLSNAIKFTDEGGTVSINLYENKETNSTILEISDTGMGIPKDKQELIFERFGQVDSNLSRHAEGTGIGLSLVKKLVDVLNGKIELESSLGTGSTFKITLPESTEIQEDNSKDFIHSEGRLVNALNIEFSDIYL